MRVLIEPVDANDGKKNVPLMSSSDRSIRWIGDCRTLGRIAQAVNSFLDTAELPAQKSARILIKPNLNNDLSALTGNSTDLRLLVSLISALKARGYNNLTIADGPNIGTYRKGLDVFERLGVKALARHLGVELVDLNRAPSVEVRVATGSVHVARICLDADFLIGVPKIKTHAEAGLSAAVKNLMGCVTGTDKWLMHADLPANLVRLNEILRPGLILVDGLFAMEGNGPGDGFPRRLDLLMAGIDAFCLDVFVARLVGLDWRNIPYLRLAHEQGLVGDAIIHDAGHVEPIAHLVPAPPRGLLTRFLDSRCLKRVRDFTRPIHRWEIVRRILHRLGIIQDVYQEADAQIDRLRLDQARCTRCGLCLEYCPVGLPILDHAFDFQKSPCVRCLYCVQVCPVDAIMIEGELGYLDRHFTRYGAQIRRAAQEGLKPV